MGRNWRIQSEQVLNRELKKPNLWPPLEILRLPSRLPSMLLLLTLTSLPGKSMPLQRLSIPSSNRLSTRGVAATKTLTYILELNFPQSKFINYSRINQGFCYSIKHLKQGKSDHQLPKSYLLVHIAVAAFAPPDYFNFLFKRQFH